ncbi:hypothetical protein HMPREF3196_01125 [Bifidobacterium bifidum]|uniref:Uncharacterized protein n=1 Tax=Bifidobacterium bifidum TaxID=1681 RepID=A0A133KNX9_BIFBI|nr:hypothetical protein HMPREF3196_01125 [Bifidobacterium bifidum]
MTISPKPSDCKGFVIASLGAGAHSVTRPAHSDGCPRNMRRVSRR